MKLKGSWGSKVKDSEIQQKGGILEMSQMPSWEKRLEYKTQL